MKRANAATAVNPLSLAALVLACSLGSSNASAMTDCMSAPGKNGYHAYRTIDGRKCWFLKVGDTFPAKSELRWTTKRIEQEDRSTALGYATEDAVEPRSSDDNIKARATKPPVAAAPLAAVAPAASEHAPMHYRMARVRAAREPSLPSQSAPDLMNGASLSASVPAHLAPPAPFSDRFSGGKD